MLNKNKKPSPFGEKASLDNPQVSFNQPLTVDTPSQASHAKVSKRRSAEPGWWIKYLVTLVTGLAAVFLVAWMRGIFDDTVINYVTQKVLRATSLDRLRILSDAFFIVGMLLFLFGALVFVSREGTFDGLFYAVKSLTWAFRLKDPRGDRVQSFHDYKAVKAVKPKTPFLHMVLVGLLFVGVAGLLTLLFFKG